MRMKSQKGYSLVEIGVGILILTVFLVCSVALFNGCYSTYRMIQQRNIATDYAITAMEEMLQTDADILTGFFVEEYNETDGKIELKANPEFKSYVKNHFNTRFVSRYAAWKGVSEDSVGMLSDQEYEAYIYGDKDYLINDYIQDTLVSLSFSEYKSEEVQGGNYGLLVNSVTEEGSLNDPITHNSMIIRKTILRLPIADESLYGIDTAFGNKVLKLKVEVIFTNKVNNQNVAEEDKKSIVLESVKVAS